MKHVLSPLALAFAIASQSSFAAIDLEQTTVTGTRTPVSFADQLSFTTLISRAKIERLQANDIFDLLSRTAGVSLSRNGGRGSATSLLLRGNQGDHSLILIDGMRTGSATLGTATLSALNLASVEKIEIVRGPKSSLYGADAIGGIVNIITRKADEDFELRYRSSFGSNSTNENTLSLGGGNGVFSTQLLATVFDTDGIDSTASKDGVNGDHDGFINKTISWNSQLKVNDAMTAQLSYSANAGESEYDTNCTDSTTFATVACDIYSDNFVDTLAAAVEVQLNKVFFTRFQAGQSRDESENLARNTDLSTTFNGGEFNTKRREATWFLHLTPNDMFHVITGVDYIDDVVTGSTAYDVSSRYNRAAFLKLGLDLDSISASISTRYDDNEQFGSEQTSSAELAYKLNSSSRIVVSYGEAFKAPTFNDLYFPGFGNASLVPESSTSYELSYRLLNENYAFVVSTYHNEVENLIQYNPEIFGSDQTAEAKITGLDAEFSFVLNDWIVGVNSSFLLPKNETNDQLLRRRSRHKLAIDVDKSLNDSFSLGYSFMFEGGRYEDIANEDRLGGYALSHLRSECLLNKHASLRFRINNVFDKQYITARSFGLGDYQNLGREFFFEVEIHPQF